MRTIAISRWASPNYFHALYKAGARPLEINRNTLLEDFDNCDGLVLPGGVDVCPKFYGQQPHHKTQMPHIERDQLELVMCKRALEKNIPILGICRGHQLLNVCMGGTLIQHMKPQHDYKHYVKIEPNSILGYIEGRISVNSLHHQALDKLGEGLRPIAIADDGAIEAVQSEYHKFVVGVQWHPEMMPFTPRFDRHMSRLWRLFVNANS